MWLAYRTVPDNKLSNNKLSDNNLSSELKKKNSFTIEEIVIVKIIRIIICAVIF